MAIQLWTYRCRAVKSVDGDTIRVIVDHGMAIFSEQSLRLNGVFAPERNEQGGSEAKLFVSAWLLEHVHDSEWPLVLRTEKDRRSFNRYVARVACLCGSDLARDIVSSGHGQTKEAR